jgi:hypothetical protein
MSALFFSTGSNLYRRSILHDPAAYPEPDSFRPERFINPDGSLRDDPVLTSAFGVGKRICPGRHLADATIFIAVASLLSVFNIEKSDGSGDGPDAYPFTGNGATYGFRISLIARKTRRLIVGVYPLVVHALSRAPSPQGIEGQKNLSGTIPKLHDLLRSFVLFCIGDFFFTSSARCTITRTVSRVDIVHLSVVRPCHVDECKALIRLRVGS